MLYIYMITREDYRNMIVSHPANTYSKYKLYKMNKHELLEYWDYICDKELNGTEKLLYDNDNDYENNSDDENNDIDDENNDDDYENNDNDDKNNDTISENDLEKSITQLKKYFISNVKNGINADSLIDDVAKQLNNLLDNCIELTKDDEEQILNDFDNFIDRYI